MSNERPLVSLAEFEQALINQDRRTAYQVLVQMDKYRELFFLSEESNKANNQSNRAVTQMMKYLCDLYGLDYRMLSGD